MSGFPKNPFGGGSFTPGGQSSANLFGSSSRDSNQSKSSGTIQIKHKFSFVKNMEKGKSFKFPSMKQ